MLIKSRGAPVSLYQWEALNRRLPAHHKKKLMVESDLKKHRSGLRGEQEVDYPLSFLADERYLILHDVRLRDQNGFFQMDTLILTEKHLLILEVKNWYGTISFGDCGQVTRIGDNGIEEGFPNPIPQAELQQLRLSKWLATRGVKDLPVNSFVVISFPSTLIKATSTHSVPNQVIHTSQLLSNIKALDQKYATPKMKLSALHDLANRLTLAHEPAHVKLLGKYGICQDELIQGVFCPICSAVPMIRKSRKWYCRQCHHRSVSGHIPACNDYLLLIWRHISNREARAFLRIESPDVAKRLLQKAGFAHTGTTKARHYQLELR